MKKLIVVLCAFFVGAAVSAASPEGSIKVSSFDLGDDCLWKCLFAISVQKGSFETDLHDWIQVQGSRGIVSLMGRGDSLASLMSAITTSFLKEKRGDEQEQLVTQFLPVRSKEHFSKFVNDFVKKFEKYCWGMRCEIEGAEDTYIALGEGFSLGVDFLLPDKCKKVTIIFEYNVAVVQSLGNYISSMLETHFSAKVIASETVTEELLKICGNETCQAPKGVSVSLCTGCLKKAYCSVACQRADWKEHKKLCKANK